MQKIEISHRTIIFTVVFILGLWFIWTIRGIILQFLIAVVLMTAFNPLVNRLEKFKVRELKMPRAVAIVLIYILLIGLLVVLVTMLAQPLVVQTSNLLNQMPLVLDRLAGLGIDQVVIERQVGQLNTLPGDILRLAGGVFSNILGIFTTLVMGFYMLLEREKLHKHLTDFLGNSQLEKKADQFIDQLEESLGGWVRAELILMVIVGVMTYIGLVLLRVPFALPLAMIAGILEIIPNIGPTLSAIPAIIVAITIQPLMAVGVLALYVMVQVMENNFIVPQVMSKAIGVNPLVTIVALLIGFELAGVTGAVLAVPSVLIIKCMLPFLGVERWGRGVEK